MKTTTAHLHRPWVLQFACLLLFGFALTAGSCIGRDEGRGGDDDDDDSGTNGGDDDDSQNVAFSLTSPDFISDSNINHSYDCDEALDPANSCMNPNPEIQWEGAPDGTVAFVLIFDDPTAGDFPHWAIYNIPASATGLAAGVSGQGSSGSPPSGSSELVNGFGGSGYLGSCPSGVNHYRWRLWAVSAEVEEPTGSSSGAQYSDLADKAEAASLGMAEMCHVFDGANADIPVGR